MKRIVLTLAALAGLAADWPEFRGPGGKAVSGDTGLPTNWSPEENIAWKTELPGKGLSCPAISGRRLFLTANSGMAQGRLHVLSIDALNGQVLWQRQFAATGQTLCHPKTNMAAPTPTVGDGMVYALFASNDLVALDVDGNVAWIRSLALDYPEATNHVGRAASPVLSGNVLIVPMENQGTSKLLGLDSKTGKTLWAVERPTENNWSTPVVVQIDGKLCVIVQQTNALVAFEPATGKELWTTEFNGLSTVPSPVVSDGLLIAAGRSGGVALKPTADGSAISWKAAKLSAGTASPIVYDGRVFSLRGDILVACSLSDGKVADELRVKGPFSASPVAADGKLYLVNESGVTTVVKVSSPKLEILATNDLKLPSLPGGEQDLILATPAISGGSIFLRTYRTLYCIRATNQRS